jgi:hypothetical protein
MMIDLMWQAALPNLPDHGIFPRKPIIKSAKSAD